MCECEPGVLLQDGGDDAVWVALVAVVVVVSPVVVVASPVVVVVASPVVVVVAFPVVVVVVSDQSLLAPVDLAAAVVSEAFFSYGDVFSFYPPVLLSGVW